MHALPVTVVFALLAAAAAPELELGQAAEGAAAAPLLADSGPVPFRLEVAARCADGAELRSLSISLADTRLPLAPAELDAEGRTEVVLEVPAAQLKGINRRLLCSDSSAPEGSLKLLRGAFSASAAARCEHPERGSRTLYASTDVDVTYWCEADVQLPEDPPPS